MLILKAGNETRFLNDNRGFTLLELLVVITIIAIMSVIALPKLTGFIGNERKESSLLVAYIEAVTDDSFVSRKVNYLCIHLAKPDIKNTEFFDDSYNDTNMVNVYNFINGKLVRNKSEVLKNRSFSSSFVLDEVILDGGRIISRGNVLIPFYSDGSSEEFSVKISSDKDKLFIKKSRINKSVQMENEF